MKTKHRSQKLSLRRDSLRVLAAGDLRHVAGGAYESPAPDVRKASLLCVSTGCG